MRVAKPPRAGDSSPLNGKYGSTGVTRVSTIPQAALHWMRAGKRVALATVVDTWGSAPCPVGSQLVVDADGAIEGSVSGGCVEGAVVTEAQEVIATGQPRLLQYGVVDEDAFSAGLACGGTIRILVEPILNAGPAGGALSVDLLETLVRAQAARAVAVYRVDLTTWARRVELPDADPGRTSAQETSVKDGVFTLVLAPPPRLILVGAVHIAQVLAPMAQAAGFAPLVTDPRSSFATPARFPGVQVICDDSDTALSQIGVDRHTAIVTLGHDPKIDDPAIMAGLEGGAFYLGCLGSRRTHAARLDRLRKQGLTDQALARLHGPVGLDIGAKGPAEIAVSILSQLIAARRGRL